MADTTSSANALIPVFTGTLSGHTALLCNARELHAFLGVGRDFTKWITDRIGNYRFVEGEDFALTVCSPDLASKPGSGGHNRRDYHLTINMAKELAMVERNDNGRQVRRYFIACEQRAAQPVGDAAGLAAERDALRKALLAENPQYRLIVKYHGIKGLTQAEKGRLLGWSAERYRLALKKLAALNLVDYAPDYTAGPRNLAAGRAAAQRGAQARLRNAAGGQP